MTNATKHAPGTSLEIVVSGSPDEGVTVELRNPLGVRRGSTPGSGLGLVGLTERAEIKRHQSKIGASDCGRNLTPHPADKIRPLAAQTK